MLDEAASMGILLAIYFLKVLLIIPIHTILSSL
jgi:hypothetical protein